VNEYFQLVDVDKFKQEHIYDDDLILSKSAQM